MVQCIAITQLESVFTESSHFTIGSHLSRIKTQKEAKEQLEKVARKRSTWKKGKEKSEE
ncbi:hypothetical protein KIN20_004689, partial [Parelaphostrongylus tenuis]